jgi:hypothetical protein
MISQAVFASNVILVAAQGVASCSQIVHLREIVPSTREKLLCLIAVAVCCSACSIAIVCISTGCSPENAMSAGERASCHHGVCTHQQSMNTEAWLTLSVGSTMDYRCDSDCSPDYHTSDPADTSFQSAPNTFEHQA